MRFPIRVFRRSCSVVPLVMIYPLSFHWCSRSQVRRNQCPLCLYSGPQIAWGIAGVDALEV